jgi:hypothetical protein
MLMVHKAHLFVSENWLTLADPFLPPPRRPKQGKIHS